MRSDLGGWGEPYRYFNPPDVLVLRAFSGGVQVAQVCNDTAFATREDILLPAELGAFAEPWNTFISQPDDLDRRIDTVPLELITAIRQKSILSPDPAESELLYTFRDLELQTASWFGAKPVQNGIEILAKELYLTSSNLLGRLVSHGTPDLLAAAAATPTVEITADLRPQSAGFITLTVDSLGRGELKARFERPAQLFVSLVASRTGTLVPLRADANWETQLLVSSGPTRRRVDARVPASAQPNELVLIVLT